MKVLFVASEVEGLVKTGGLADVARALPESLKQQGVEVKIVAPYYKKQISPKPALEIPALDVSLSENCRFGVAVRFTEISDTPVYLIEHNRFFEREGIYDDGYHAYEDNALRYGLLSKAALNLCAALNWYPDIIHCNDWQTAILPYYLKHHMVGHKGFSHTKSLLTIHNGFFQGRVPNPLRKDLGIAEEYYQPDYFEDHEMVNLLKGGIMFADGVSTVSPGYREEMLEPETSHGLWQTLAARKERFIGILNGCDYQQWDPETDPLINQSFNQQDLSGKAFCKTELQKIFGFMTNPDVPLFGMVSRLTDQKGFDLSIPAIDLFLAKNPTAGQFVVLGSGDPRYVDQLNELSERYPSQFRFSEGYNNSLAHQIEAGCDYFLMPSLFEPCGLNQIYSLKYGTLPIVRTTGGLGDTVVGLNINQSNLKKATGFSFADRNIMTCLDVLQRAARLYTNNHDRFIKMQQNAMAQDFSWTKPAQKYQETYQKLLDEKPIKS